VIHQDENGHSYYLNQEEMKESGLTPIKAWNVLQFFTLAGKKTTLSKNSLLPIADLKYVVLAKYPGEDRYFLREYRGYGVDELYWYRRTETFSGEDEAIENLRRYTDDGRVTLLMTPIQVAETSDMLKRLWRAEFKEDGQLPYKVFIPLLETSLKLEDYRDVGKNLTGFKTICNQMELQIQELWKSVMK
jgi:hypothetical protein